MTPEQAVLRSKEAKMILSHDVFKEAVVKMNDYIIGQQAMVNLDNKDMCQRLILAKQMLDQFIHQFSIIINDGEAAKIRMKQLEPTTFEKVRHLVR